MSASERAQIKRATLAAIEQLKRLDAAGAAALADIYSAAANALRAAIARHAGSDGTVSIVESRSVLAQVESILQNLSYQRDSTIITPGLERAATGGAQAVVLQSSASMRVAEKALIFAKNFVAEDGLMLSDRLWRIDRGVKQALTSAIELAVVQGHGSAQAAREFLAKGMPVPTEVAARMGAANSVVLGNEAVRLMTGDGQALYQAQRVFRTEINRAHGEAYMAGAAEHPDFAGFRFLLSPNHPKHDICDLLASQNLYGLGPGVYPSREKCPWPAHPNTLSFVESVYLDEVTEADKAGKETPMQALSRLPEAVRVGVLGKGKSEIFDAGDLKQGMIRATLGAVKRRVGGD